MHTRKLRAWLLGIVAVVAATIVTNGSLSADEYDDCHHCRLHKLHKYRDIEGRDPHFNCGCNGSYKFPVPPLSTYHWPGMYSQRLMTDYQSPWRFPPIKPYTDEPKAEVKTEAPKASTSRVRLVPVPR